MRSQQELMERGMAEPYKPKPGNSWYDCPEAIASAEKMKRESEGWFGKFWLKIRAWGMLATVITPIYLINHYEPYVESARKDEWLILVGILFFVILILAKCFWYPDEAAENMKNSGKIRKALLSPVGNHVFENYTEYTAIVNSVSDRVADNLADKMKSD